jgi:hypothetical protein
MSRKDLIHRGYRSWDDFYFDLMIKSRIGPEGPQEMYMELKTAERRGCMSYLADRIYTQDADALEALKSIAIIL